LDELGRGTSTHDGTAIAHAVLDAISVAGPLMLFSTHYPSLTTKASSAIANYHMSYHLEDSNGGEQAASEVTFLYRPVS